MRLRYIYLFLLLLFTSAILKSQNILSLEEAIQTAKKENLNIDMTKMQAQLADMQVYRANAGLTPRLDWNTAFNGSGNFVNQTFFDGRSINRLGRTLAPSTNLALSYTIYDGNRGKTRLSLLQAQADRSHMMIEGIEEAVEFDVVQTYLDIAKQKSTIAYLNKTISFYKERMDITEERWIVGRGSKLDFLQSQNDMNAQKAALTNAKALLQSLKQYMNLLLNRDANTDFDVDETPPSSNLYSADEMLAMAIENDENLKLIKQDRIINDLRKTELKGAKLPLVNLNSTFGYSLSNSNAGLLLLNQNLGLNAGVTASWNIYDGNNINTQIKINEFQNNVLDKQQNLEVENLKNRIAVAIYQWENAKSLLELESTNKAIAEENLTISLEKFRLGGSTILEVNEAQRRYDDAQFRHVNAFYGVKYAELALEMIIK
ncbi:MAG: TolC family protein [Saprospiraceae bacterium]|nr:TolC family protein [Saprospiraceae bacterium]